MGFKAAQRLEKFQTGIFAAMDAKKEALIASGREVINLSIGTPDFEPSRHVMEAVKEAVGDPFNYRYSLTDTPELLEALVSYYKRRYQTDIRPEEITGVHGTQEGMGHLGLAMVNPGDVVLLPDPGYPIYEAGSLLADAEIYYYGMVKENDFLPDMKEIPEDILKRARFIVLSYPSNPVGASAPKEMYLDMISLAKKYGFFIINDNAYSDIIFDGREGFSFLSLPEAKEVGVEFFSLSKSFNLTGLRLSYLIGNKDSCQNDKDSRCLVSRRKLFQKNKDDRNDHDIHGSDRADSRCGKIVQTELFKNHVSHDQERQDQPSYKRHPVDSLQPLTHQEKQNQSRDTGCQCQIRID